MSRRLPPNLLPEGYKITWLPLRGYLVCPPSDDYCAHLATPIKTVTQTASRSLKKRINGLFCRLQRAHEFKNDTCVVCGIGR